MADHVAMSASILNLDCQAQLSDVFQGPITIKHAEAGPELDQRIDIEEESPRFLSVLKTPWKKVHAPYCLDA